MTPTVGSRSFINDRRDKQGKLKQVTRDGAKAERPREAAEVEVGVLERELESLVVEKVARGESVEGLVGVWDQEGELGELVRVKAKASVFNREW